MPWDARTDKTQDKLFTEKGEQSDAGSQGQADTGCQGGGGNSHSEMYDKQPVEKQIGECDEDIHPHTVDSPAAYPQIIVKCKEDHDKRGKYGIDPHIFNRQVQDVIPGAHQSDRLRPSKESGQAYETGDGDDKQAAETEYGAGLPFFPLPQTD